jgi:hypothetical protein
VLFVVVTMLVILAVCGLVLMYVAFPSRGEELPAVPWLGDAMAKAAEAVPTLDADETDAPARKH